MNYRLKLIINQITCIFIIIFLIKSQHLYAQTQPQITTEAIKENFYATVDSLNCGDKTVVITSSCYARNNENSDPICLSQNVSFINKKLNLVNFYTYLYDREKPSYIYSATCLKTKHKFYLELKSSNLGSCRICEWNDFFDWEGIYIASTRGLPNKTSFKQKNISKDFEGMITHAQVIRGINLTTVQH